MTENEKEKEKDKKLTTEHGKLGLKNLGNTCYLNAAIQCLTHTKELIPYFMNGDYKKDLDKQYSELTTLLSTQDLDNMTQSDLAYLFTKYFCDLFIEIWSNGRELIVPNHFRQTLMRLFKQFDNNLQQDAHEFLTVVLDTLHQQFNRVENENEMIMDENVLESIYSSQALILSRGISQTYWNSHKKFNDSIITDLFFGQLKSTLHCLNCGETYSTFEPFSSLGLPIPNEYKILLYFVPMSKKMKPYKMFVKINDNMQFKNIIDKVKNLVDYEFSSGIFYSVVNNKFAKLIDLDERCGDLMNRVSFLFLIESKKTTHDYSNTTNRMYTCLNFKIYDDQNGNEVKNLKAASFPRLFLFDEISLTNSFYEEKNLILKIFNTLSDYIKNFVAKDINDLYQKKLLYFSVDSSDIPENENKCCLICSKENSEVFLCNCVNDLFFNSNSKKKEFSFNLIKFLTSKKNFEEFILHVNININTQEIKYKELNRCLDYTSKESDKKNLNLYDLLDYFSGEEKFNTSDNYQCNYCKKNVPANKKMEINKFPQILIINLKRFRYDMNPLGRGRICRRENGMHNGPGEKNESMIDFPVCNFDLKKYSKNGTSINYELYAICNHSGKINAGHYTAICKHSINYKWIEFDDKNVKTIVENNLVTPNAYLLFYRRKDN